ncbi:MAG: TetR/AcrR family transcriptional regulator [Arcobacteraceae bacterium]|jgi:AcrR family transcriptional regulator|nr:TetR/AcrR family transcriptional regulator [Arcobacteraceae bacterium]
MEKKELKRRYIAKSCCELFSKNGFSNITVEAIAKNAGVGKGTIYEYFEKKEDIILELMGCLQEEYDTNHQAKLHNVQNPKEKLFVLFDIFLSDDEMVKMQKDIYKQFLMITFVNPSDSLLYYHEQLRKKYICVIAKISNKFDGGLIFDTIIGFFTISISTKNYDLKSTITHYLNKIGGTH